MSDSHIVSWVLVALASGGVGFLVGTAFFANLRHVSARIVADPAPLYFAAAAIVRTGAAVLVFFFLTRWGPAAVLSALAGFTFARRRMLGQMEREP